MRQETKFELLAQMSTLKALVAKTKRELGEAIERDNDRELHPWHSQLVRDAQNGLQTAILNIDASKASLERCDAEI